MSVGDGVKPLGMMRHMQGGWIERGLRPVAAPLPPLATPQGSDGASRRGAQSGLQRVHAPSLGKQRISTPISGS